MRREKTQIEKIKDEISKSKGAKNLGLLRKEREYKDANAQITIKGSGVYKIGMDPKSRYTTSAVNEKDFVP